MRGRINPHMLGANYKPYPGSDYYQFKDVEEIKQSLIKHIKKLTNDIQWAKTSYFGFFVNTELKTEKIDGLQKIYNAFQSNVIDEKNYNTFLKVIESGYQHIHDGYYFSNESHKIINGIKKYFASQCKVDDKKANNRMDFK